MCGKISNVAPSYVLDELSAIVVVGSQVFEASVAAHVTDCPALLLARINIGECDTFIGLNYSHCPDYRRIRHKQREKKSKQRYKRQNEHDASASNPWKNVKGVPTDSIGSVYVFQRIPCSLSRYENFSEWWRLVARYQKNNRNARVHIIDIT